MIVHVQSAYMNLASVLSVTMKRGPKHLLIMGFLWKPQEFRKLNYDYVSLR